MKLVQKWVISVASLAASKHAIAAAVTTAAAAMAIAPSIGFDPVTWFLSGVGAVVAHLKMVETLRRVAIANGIISVILGGFGGPYINAILMKYEFPQLPVYLAAFGLAVAWPFIAAKVIELWDKKVVS